MEWENGSEEIRSLEDRKMGSLENGKQAEIRGQKSEMLDS